jgi:recombination DNA repair RAD52 pathway protein
MGREISYRAGGRGRDGSQGQGQGSQGRGSRDNRPKASNASSKAPEMKFIPDRIGKEVRQTATYQTVKDYIIQLVQKSFRNGKDVADSIRKMDRIDMTSKIPIRRISVATDADNRVTEQEGYNILYKAEIK